MSIAANTQATETTTLVPTHVAPLAGWRRGSKVRRCNAFPTVWAAIHGCSGSSNAWRYTVGAFGHRVAEYACPTCQAARARTEGLMGRAYADALRAEQDAAGVSDYRTQPARWIDGRPQLIR